MRYKKNPRYDLKLKYRKTMECSLIISLLLLITIFEVFPQKFQSEARYKEVQLAKIEVEDIPKTEQLTKAPPPPRPVVPIASESEDIPEDLTIEDTEIDFTEIPPPPPLPTSSEDDIEQGYRFVAYDKAPEPIGGFAVIQSYLEYPEIARKAGMEAYLIIGVLIDERGYVIKTQVMQESGSNVGFEDAAQKAVIQVKWKPAMQRDKPAKVWISIPIRFRLKEIVSSK